MKPILAAGFLTILFASNAHATIRGPLEKILVRPPAVASIDSQSLPLRVHYQENVSIEYAQTILNTAEIAWTKMFVEMAFLEPLADKGEGGSKAFDLYIVTNLQAGIGGYTSFSGFNEDTPRQDAFGFTVFAHDLKTKYLRGVVAHELFHASQMAYDWWEDIAFMEASATWIVDHVFDDENLYWKYYSYYNRQPWKALDFISLADPYQYGSGMFLQFLDERYGSGDGSFVRLIWENSVQNDMINEPDYFDAIEDLLLERGSSFDAAFHEFGSWRFFVGTRDDGRHFAEGAEWGEEMLVPFAADVYWNGKDSQSGIFEKPMQPYSHSFMRIVSNSKSGKDLPAKINLTTTPETRLQIKWLVRSGSATVCQGDSAVLLGGGVFGLLEGCDLPLGGLEVYELILYVSNLADGKYDTESPVWTESPIFWNF